MRENHKEPKEAAEMLVLVNTELNTHVKSIVYKGRFLDQRMRFAYKYGKLFFRCNLWIELATHSIQFDEYMRLGKYNNKKKLPQGTSRKYHKKAIRSRISA